jgi:Zn-dependent alcohol dehydrogenase
VDRGVVLTGIGRFGLEELELDEPGPGEVLVRIEASGVCGTDAHVVRTGWGHRLPVLLGHEGAGVVEEVGEGVSHVRGGDRPAEAAAGVCAARATFAARRRGPRAGSHFGMETPSAEHCN